MRSPAAAARLVTAVALSALLAGCTAAVDVPDRAPDVTGLVADAGSAAGPTLSDPSDTYYERMTLTGSDLVVVGLDGDAATLADLDDGDEVEVWVGDACAESFPVQCELVAVRVVGSGG